MRLGGRCHPVQKGSSSRTYGPQEVDLKSRGCTQSTKKIVYPMPVQWYGNYSSRSSGTQVEHAVLYGTIKREELLDSSVFEKKISN